MGRAHHLKLTLPHNMALLKSYRKAYQVLLDYNSPDDLGGWIRARFQPELISGLLVYFHTTEPRTFLTAHAKNVAHRLAHGEHLCNLDADNILTPEFLEEVILELPTGCRDRILVSYTPGGAYGRTVVPKVIFDQLGGYDEEMCYGWGYEDTDLRRRAQLSGHKVSVLNGAYLSYLEHPDDERVSRCISKYPSASEKMHAEISRVKIERGQLVANVGVHWGAASLIKNFEEQVMI
jgi:hypothetical protein